MLIPSISCDLAFHEPDHTPRHQFDIGPFMGIAPAHTERDDVDLFPNVMTDENYYDYLSAQQKARRISYSHYASSSSKFRTSFVCITWWSRNWQINSHSCNYQGLYGLLNKRSGEDFSVPHALLVAPTGRAAYNIHGCTIHHAFMIAANQKLEHRAPFLG